jgi:hypothetical protein
MRISLAATAIRTHLRMGLGVRLGTIDVMSPSASASAERLKVTFMADLSKSTGAHVRHELTQTASVYRHSAVATTLFAGNAPEAESRISQKTRGSIRRIF